MPRREEIEIQEPPMQALQKNRSCFKRSCFGGCGCLFLVCICFIILLKVVAVPDVKRLKDVPEIFPSTFPLYDKINIDKITYLSAKEKHQSIERAAYLPKMILIPLYLTFKEYLPGKYHIPGEAPKDTSSLKRFRTLLRQPIFGDTDTITITWSQLTARPTFIADYYRTELERDGFLVASTTAYGDTQSISFADASSTIDGKINITDATPADRGTDTIELSMSFHRHP